MAFPTVAGTNTYASAATGTSHNVNLPASIASGDLLVAWVASAGAAANTPSGWTLLNTFSLTYIFGKVFYKTASGSEGSTVAITFGSSTHVAATTYRITGQHASTAPEAGSDSNGTGTNPDAGSLNPAGWGTEDTLWIALGGSTSVAPSAAPASYSGLLTPQASGIVAFSAWRQLNAASEDPGGFTASSSNWQANLIAIRPSTGITGTGSEIAPVAQIAAEGGVYRQSLSWVTIA